MKTKLRLFLIAGLLLPIMAFTPVAVLAHEGDGGHEHGNDIAQADETDNEEAPLDREALQARIAERKAALQTRLDAARQARIQNRCEMAQGKLNSIRGRIKGLETSRTQVYENLVARLNKLSEHLKTKDVDTAALDGQITELVTLIETFNTDLATYKEAVGDLAVMDCAEDPTGFQASLETARAARSKVAEDAKAIRTLLSDSIKPALVELRKSMEGDTADETETEAENETEGEESQ